ncbi:MAG: hypothetical protein ACHREM_13255 [Polyangiales bacterium]
MSIDAVYLVLLGLIISAAGAYASIRAARRSHPESSLLSKRAVNMLVATDFVSALVIGTVVVFGFCGIYYAGSKLLSKRPPDAGSARKEDVVEDARPIEVPTDAGIKRDNDDANTPAHLPPPLVRVLPKDLPPNDPPEETDKRPTPVVPSPELSPPTLRRPTRGPTPIVKQTLPVLPPELARPSTASTIGPPRGHPPSPMDDFVDDP